TVLINKFREGKKSIYFVATEASAKENLELFSARILSVLAPEGPKNPFASFTEAFDYCFRAGSRERIILVIDEYPYLAESDRAVSSILQAAIDAHRDKSRLFLILCGSSMSFMENQVLGYKSPLYGRRTCQFKVMPFTYCECAEMLRGFTEKEKITLYGACGGIPEYVSHINNSLPVARNLEELFFNPSGRLFEEPSNLLKQELKAPRTYNSIITAIARGGSRLNDIAAKAGIETSQCSNMLSALAGLGIVKKEYPVTGAGSRKTIYLLADFMFRFWYRFVLPDLSRISMGLGRTVCRELTGDKIEAYTGYVFEECARQFMLRELGRGTFSFTDIGRWWGANPALRREEEIDILAINGQSAVFGECKWRNQKTGVDVFNDLVRKSELFHQFKTREYILFSKSGFSPALVKAAAQRKLIPVSPKDMF
ncbi:MAG: ATP-binding protein, partial [Treponema sp.]|nr:ATP-binding protein [Treponema sp.]